MAINCRISAYEAAGNKNGAKAFGKSPVIILEIIRKGAAPQRVTVAGTQVVALEFGDRLRCVAGFAAVLINPGTGAGAFILCAQIPPQANWNYRTELEINEETTRIISRGKMWAAGDIGNTQRGTGAVSR